MSKKMMSSSPCRRKLLLVLIPLLAIALIAAAIGIYRLATYESANHASLMSKADLRACNSTATNKAQINSRIAQQEILILYSLEKDYQTDSDAVFYIYRLPEGGSAADYYGLTTAEIDALGSLTLMGTLSCRMVGNDVSTAYNVKVTYQR